MDINNKQKNNGGVKMPNMKECLKPHALLHSLSGFGIGLILASLIPALSTRTGLWLGVILLVVAIIGEFMVKK